MIHEIIQGRHQTLVNEGIGDLPIGRIPADKQYFLSERFSHGIVKRGGAVPRGDTVYYVCGRKTRRERGCANAAGRIKSYVKTAFAGGHEV